MNSIWGEEQTKFFYELDPDTILSAVEEQGLKVTGAFHALNSMENRVYQIQIEPDTLLEDYDVANTLIAKFYRPGRWTKEQILEEHQFLLELNLDEIPVVAPIVINKQTLFQLKGSGIFYTFFPKVGGRAPDDYNDDQLEQLGRLLGRLHSVGRNTRSKHRLQLTPSQFAKNNLDYLLENSILPTDIKDKYKDAVEDLIKLITPMFEGITMQRIHGDCHQSNILWRDQQASLIDFDDMLIGPPVQDLWLLIPGQDQESKRRMNVLLEGYESILDFDYQSLSLIEPLRALRYIHFSTWISRRYSDPAFQKAFPYFANNDFWYQALQDLYEQNILISKIID